MHNKSGPMPASPPTHWAKTTPAIRERLGHEIADLLDDIFYQHPDFARALQPAGATQQYHTQYTMGMWEGSRRDP